MGRSRSPSLWTGRQTCGTTSQSRLRKSVSNLSWLSPLMNCDTSFSNHLLDLHRHAALTGGDEHRAASPASWFLSGKGITDLRHTILYLRLQPVPLIAPTICHKQLAFETTEALNMLICWVLIELNSSVVNLWKCKNIKTYQINSFKGRLRSGLLQRQHPLQIKEHLRTAKLTDYVENLAGRATNSSNHM